MFSPQAVANYLLDKARDDGELLTHMKLQKLVYIAHGWHLAVTGKPLLSDPVEAWQFGPVIRSLYHDLKHFGHEPISGRLRDSIPNPGTDTFEVACADFPDETKSVLDRVWDVYKKFNGVQLSSMTHKPNTPWHDVAGSMTREQVKARDLVIKDDEIRKHYLTLARKGK